MEARESIRDLVARYNANGDSGRYAVVVGLFAPDGVLETSDGSGARVARRGHTEIETVFTGAAARFAEGASERKAPTLVRHHTTTHQIDFVDRDHATGRSYFQVLMAHGLDHWGRYLDDYVRIDGRWLFQSRRAFTEGFAAERQG